MRRLLTIAIALAGLGIAAPAASADRPLLPQATITGSTSPNGSFDNACGVAIDSQGNQYVSDYYHGAVDVFASAGTYVTRIASEVEGNAACDLAAGAAGRLYVAYHHGEVRAYTPSLFPFFSSTPPTYASELIDPGPATGVAIDPADGRVYVNRRTYVAVYEADGEPVEAPGGGPLRIGDGELGEAYGLAVSAYPGTAGRVYVADAGADADAGAGEGGEGLSNESVVEAFDPAIDPDTPVATISGSAAGPFRDFTNADLAVDPTGGQLLAIDNLEPGFASPDGAIYEFDPAGDYLGQVDLDLVHGGPSGLTVAPNGMTYVTSGNEQPSVVYVLGPPSAAAGFADTPPATDTPPVVTATARRTVSSTPIRGPIGVSAGRPFLFGTEVIRKRDVRLSFGGDLRPRRLPRRRLIPVTVSMSGRIEPTKGDKPPQLQRLEIAINRHGVIDGRGLPTCAIDDIQPATTEAALATCRRSLVGRGHFSARVLIPDGSPYPSEGTLLAYYGRYRGRPAILGHVYGTQPAPTSVTLPFLIRRTPGTYGASLSLALPDVTGPWGYVTGLDLTLHRTYRFRGHRRSFISASCPAPAGIAIAPFPLARGTFGFGGGREIESVVKQACRPR